MQNLIKLFDQSLSHPDPVTGEAAVDVGLLPQEEAGDPAADEDFEAFELFSTFSDPHPVPFTGEDLTLAGSSQPLPVVGDVGLDDG